MAAKIGIISFAHLHAHAYAASLQQLAGQATIAGIYDDNADRGKAAAEQYQSTFFGSINELFDQNLDGVIICSENIKHKEFVLQSAELGKPILCEKPISTNVLDAEEMIKVCEQNNAPLMIAFPVRFSAPMFRAKLYVQENKLGNIIAMKGTNRGTMPGDWFIQKELSGGGAVLDHTVHIVDAWRWMLKKEVISVYAESDQLFYNDINIDDTGLLSLEFEDGIFATLDTSWSRPNASFPTWGDATMEIVGDQGSLWVDAFKQKFDIYNNDAVKAQWDCWTDDINLGLIQSFVKTVTEGKSPAVTGHDGLKAMEVALAAYRSIESGEPVSLPLTN